MSLLSRTKIGGGTNSRKIGHWACIGILNFVGLIEKQLNGIALNDGVIFWWFGAWESICGLGQVKKGARVDTPYPPLCICI